LPARGVGFFHHHGDRLITSSNDRSMRQAETTETTPLLPTNPPEAKPQAVPEQAQPAAYREKPYPPTSTAVVRYPLESNSCVAWFVHVALSASK